MKEMKQRFMDLANACYQRGHYTFTHFLSPGEIDEFYQIQNEISFVGHTLYGGSPSSERQMVRFGDEEMFGYDEAFPICCVHCRPLAPKFAENLGHRDVLGALMNLGIEREVIGDIFIRDKVCYFFCLAEMTAYICENLTKIRHTNVTCRETEELPEDFKPVLRQEEYIIASERCDALISKVYNLSRGKCIPLFQEKKVFVNSRQFENNSGVLKAGDVVSFRGFGKFIYGGVLRETKKGRITVKIEKYV